MLIRRSIPAQVLMDLMPSCTGPTLEAASTLLATILYRKTELDVFRAEGGIDTSLTRLAELLTYAATHGQAGTRARQRTHTYTHTRIGTWTSWTRVSGW